MTRAPTVTVISDQQQDAFLEDATNGWLDAAEVHKISTQMAEVILLDELLRDCHMADPDLTRAYVLATLDALDLPPETDQAAPAAADAWARREANGVALVAAIATACDMGDLVTTVIPGARLQ